MGKANLSHVEMIPWVIVSLIIQAMSNEPVNILVGRKIHFCNGKLKFCLNDFCKGDNIIGAEQSKIVFQTSV